MSGTPRFVVCGRSFNMWLCAVNSPTSAGRAKKNSTAIVRSVNLCEEERSDVHVYVQLGLQLGRVLSGSAVALPM